MGLDVSDVELAVAPACWLSAFKTCAFNRCCLVFETGCAALGSFLCSKQTVQHCVCSQEEKAGSVYRLCSTVVARSVQPILASAGVSSHVVDGEGFGDEG